MTSPRTLALLAIGLTIAAALPTDRTVPKPVTTITDEDLEESTWLTFPLFGNLFAPLWKLFPTFYSAGPQIISDNDKFQVVINVKDYKKSELKVKVKGIFILIQGTHEVGGSTKDVFASQFFQTYSMPENASAADVTAELSTDGYLIVTAPVKPGSKTESAERDVDITETGTPYKAETSTAAVENVDQTGATASDNEDERKEPTTPVPVSTEAPKLELSEGAAKENSIPHGNEPVLP